MITISQAPPPDHQPDTDPRKVSLKVYGTARERHAVSSRWIPKDPLIRLLDLVIGPPPAIDLLPIACSQLGSYMGTFSFMDFQPESAQRAPRSLHESRQIESHGPCHFQNHCEPAKHTPVATCVWQCTEIGPWFLMLT